MSNLNETNGFIELTGPIAQSKLDFIRVNSYHPIHTAFGARSTPATISYNRINDISNNSCTYQGNSYTLIDIQICQLLHKGFGLPAINDTASAEMILTFSGSDPAGILICFPIYNTGVSNNDEYLNQVIDQPLTTNVTLESLFKDQSLAYRTNFDIDTSNGTNTKSTDTSSLYIVVFPNGIHLEGSKYQKLMGMIGTLPVYTIPPVVRNGLPTVKKSEIVNGARRPTQISTKGEINSSSIATCNKEFTDKFEHFIKPPVSVKATATSSTASCPLYPTSQYKCVPFNQYNSSMDPKNAFVRVTKNDAHLTLDNTIKYNDMQSKQPINPNSIQLDKIADFEEGIAITATVIAGILFMAGVWFAITK